MRHAWRLAFLAALATCYGISLAQAQTMISQTTASRYGLSRAWYAQVGSARATGSLEYVNFDEGMLLVQSSRGMLTAIDADTGRTLWETQIGPPGRSNSEPAANDKYVVVLNGSTLYVVNRSDGSIAWHRQVRGAPGAGPGISQTHAFVPIITGLVEGYNLEEGAKQTPWNYQSSGRVLTPPMTTGMSVSWTTERGYFYVADPAGGGIRYRLETGDEIHARPAAWSPRLFAGSADGFVYAVDEKQGSIAWKFAAGEAIYEHPVAIDGKLFVVTEFDGMYCLDSADGNPLWHAGNVGQFVAASPSRVYVCDRLGDLAILDIRGGARLGAMRLTGIVTKVVNSRSDRIFLIDNSCTIQCLHETQLASPVVYTPPAPKQPDLKLTPRKPAAAKEMPAEAPAAPPAEDSFDNPPENGADEVENPFDNIP